MKLLSFTILLSLISLLAATQLSCESSCAAYRLCASLQVNCPLPVGCYCDDNNDEPNALQGEVDPFVKFLKKQKKSESKKITDIRKLLKKYPLKKKSVKQEDEDENSRSTKKVNCYKVYDYNGGYTYKCKNYGNDDEDDNEDEIYENDERNFIFRAHDDERLYDFLCTKYSDGEIICDYRK